MSKPEDYLNQNIKGILQPMVKDILSQRPKDPVNKIIYKIYFILIDLFYD